jgi:CRP-like cAMP-binding protein/predicted GNAT family N-acyltransferase
VTAVRVEVAATPAERETVYRLRYDVFVEEMHLFRGRADHERRMLVEDCDAVSRLLLATVDGEPVGTMRLTLGKDGPLGDEFEETYGIGGWTVHAVPAEQVMVCTRFAVRKDHRAGWAAFELIRGAIRCAVEDDIELVFCDCQPHLLNLYTSLGFRSYRPTYPDSEYGVMVPLVLIGRDVAHLESVGSPILDVLTLSPTATTERALALVPPTPAVRSTDGLSDMEVDELHRVSGGEAAGGVATGLSTEEFRDLLGGGYVIQLSEGDYLIRKDQVTRTVYVILSGAVEVRDGERTIAVVRRGDVVGEMAFLLEDQRSLDVRAATDNTRVLSFRDRTVRRVLKRRNPTATQLLANLEQTVARRLSGAR